MTMNLYNHEKMLDRQIEIVSKSDILEENKEMIVQFKDYLLSEGIGIAKIARYLVELRKLASMHNKSLKEADEKALRKVVAVIEQGSLAPQTKKLFKIAIRKFYRFIRGVTEKGVYPPEVKWISIAIAEKNNKLPEELLNEEEIKAVIRACRSVRDKALVSVLAESGCRISEIGLMKIKQISFDEYGARLSVTGKTGARRILVISSVPYLTSWLNEHPNNDNPESYLWYNPQDGKFLCYTRIADILKAAARRAGIKKKIHPHLLRHSRATILAPIMSESAMKQYFGWTQSSKMASIYIHLSGKDTDEAILRANGIIVKKEKTQYFLKPMKCERCKTINETTNKFCKTCSFVLDEEARNEALKKESQRMEVNNLMDEIVKDKEILELMMKRIKEVKKENLNNGKV